MGDGSATTITVPQTFEQEPVDRVWRTDTEAQIRRRLPAASEVECHTTLCRIVVVGSEHDLTAAVDRMESEQSLRGIAQSILLTAPEHRADRHRSRFGPTHAFDHASAP